MAGEVTTEAERDLLARLDLAFAHQRELDPAILASIRAWQRTDRNYELVQRLVRGRPFEESDTPLLASAHSLREHLHLAIQSGRLPFPLRVFRGLRDIEVSLGISHPAEAPGLRLGLSGFCATTVFRRVAAREFTAPRGALLDLRLPAGTPALWIAGLGSDSLRQQGELLLGFDTEIDVYSHAEPTGAVPILTGGVVLDEPLQ